ncbi:hypothetical protein PR048_025608 [Dryococelus australis]|uniref:Uncharacterized protein n=1 Tax=Dryococelus australis TaxID=614101 RepID=A0ABQ9GRS4_9NEOP|nr:hypothetical protein PR048_025608 [Dryococelus australis]
MALNSVVHESTHQSSSVMLFSTEIPIPSSIYGRCRMRVFIVLVIKSWKGGLVAYAHGQLWWRRDAVRAGGLSCTFTRDLPNIDTWNEALRAMLYSWFVTSVPLNPTITSETTYLVVKQISGCLGYRQLYHLMKGCTFSNTVFCGYQPSNLLNSQATLSVAV